MSAALQYFVSSWWATWLGFWPLFPKDAISWMSLQKRFARTSLLPWPELVKKAPGSIKATALCCACKIHSCQMPKHIQIFMCRQDADMPLAKCSSKQVPRGDISSPSRVELAPCPSYFFLFHLAIIKVKPLHKARLCPWARLC